MRRKLKQMNRFTLAAFAFGMILLLTNNADPKWCVGYSIFMSIYYLFAELFDFHLWEASDCRKKELNAFIGGKEKQHDKTRNY